MKRKFYLRGNPAQNEAITHDTGPCLVLAGPGSGKTFVITERARYLIVKRGVPPSRVLTLTFTRAAAGEMRRRFQRETGGAYGGAVFATFHSFFYSILKEYTDYEVRTLDSGEPDYDDMLTTCYERLQADGALLRRIRERFRYIQTDEFQDVSPVQASLLTLIAGEGGNLFCVGDDDQSIYAFRGADPDVMKQFVRSMKDVRVIRLTINYRCREKIIGLSTALIKKNKNRFSKKTKAGRTDEKGDVSLQMYEDVSEEIASILTQYQRLQASGAHCAIIVRTNEEAERFLDHGRRLFKMERVRVMTLHAAKGLEFDTVFLPRLNEGVLPVTRGGDRKHIEEERRLLYVGITRALKAVVLSCVKNESYDGVPSRFLKELLPYLRKHGSYAIFKSKFQFRQHKRSTVNIGRIYDPAGGTLSARLS